MKEETFNKWFNVFILAGMTVALILTTILKLGGSDAGRFLLIISAFGSLMGVLSTVCSANGKIWTFLFGFLDVTIYGIMCFINWKNGGAGLGNAILHAVYFVPMQFVGFSQWRKRGAGSSRQVQARRFTPAQWVLYTSIFVVGSIVAYIILAQFDKSAATSFIKIAVVCDVLPLVCNILGQLLMSWAYAEQWIFWIGVNIFSILMWSLSLKSGGNDYAAIYIIKYSFYLVNSINGLRIWLRLSRQPECLDK